MNVFNELSALSHCFYRNVLVLSPALVFLPLQAGLGGERAAGTRGVNLALLFLACLVKSLFTL